MNNNFTTVKCRSKYEAFCANKNSAGARKKQFL